MAATTGAARRLWQAVEPIHSTVYFAPGPAEAAKALGLRGWWMGYFAGRFAPLGPVPPEPVTAMAFGFAPHMVARSLPDAWSFAAPADVVARRVASAADALRAALPDDALTGAGELARLTADAAAACRHDGRPLAAAWSAVDEPGDDVARLWLAATVLREHRGDGHVAAAVTLGLTGLEATVTHAAAGATGRRLMQRTRGWTDEEWDSAEAGLRDRGLLDGSGRPTPDGVALRRELEEATDRAASAPADHLGDDGVARLVALAAPLGRHLVDAGVIPVPNPIGVPRP